ncbi:MAG: adenylyl-sulfate kinase [Sphingomonadales bacterium]
MKKGLLKFITCGSVDCGKSTLLGHLLAKAGQVPKDQLENLKVLSGDEVDYSLLLDGLAAEREQGITIDVAYRYFSTPKRSFIVADCPGHEEYTSNMATGASTANLALIIIDAKVGITTQTKRHTIICSLLGIENFVVVINKMDEVGYAENIYNLQVSELESFAKEILPASFVAIPVSATRGDNITVNSEKMAWYVGQPLLEVLESSETQELATDKPFRFSVSKVAKDDGGIRHYQGLVTAGEVKKGDKVTLLPNGQKTEVENIYLGEKLLNSGGAAQSLALTLKGDNDLSKGGVIVKENAPAEVEDQFQVKVISLGKNPVFAGRPYIIKTQNNLMPGVLTDIKYKINPDTLEHTATDKLSKNELGICNISLDKKIPFDAYKDNRMMGSFLIIDRSTNETVAMGMIDFALRRSTNIHWQDLEINKGARSLAKGQKPAILWFTGLSGSGKSTIGNIVEQKLHTRGLHTTLLDGDNVRHGLNRDLGFTEADRVENIRRAGEVAKLMLESGLMTLVSFISPFRSERRLVRDMVDQDEFIEVFVDTPLSVCETRDPKGLYSKARAGEIKNFTGLDSPYEAPEHPEIVVNTIETTPDQAADIIIKYLEDNGFIKN